MCLHCLSRWTAVGWVSSVQKVSRLRKAQGKRTNSCKLPASATAALGFTYFITPFKRPQSNIFDSFSMAHLPILFVAYLFATPVAVLSAVTLPAVFSDGVVLQTRVEYGQRAFIYGSAAEGETVAVNVTRSGSSASYITSADSTGSWDVQLNPENDDSSTAVISVAGSSDGFAKVVYIRDVHFGDVFLCSGYAKCSVRLESACMSLETLHLCVLFPDKATWTSL